MKVGFIFLILGQATLLGCSMQYKITGGSHPPTPPRLAQKPSLALENVQYYPQSGGVILLNFPDKGKCYCKIEKLGYDGRNYASLKTCSYLLGTISNSECDRYSYSDQYYE